MIISPSCSLSGAMWPENHGNSCQTLSLSFSWCKVIHKFYNNVTFFPFFRVWKMRHQFSLSFMALPATSIRHSFVISNSDSRTTHRQCHDDGCSHPHGIQVLRNSFFDGIVSLLDGLYHKFFKALFFQCLFHLIRGEASFGLLNGDGRCHLTGVSAPYPVGHNQKRPILLQRVEIASRSVRPKWMFKVGTSNESILILKPYLSTVTYGSYLDFLI